MSGYQKESSQICCERETGGGAYLNEDEGTGGNRAMWLVDIDVNAMIR